VVSLKTFLTKYPNGKVPRHSKDFGKVFVCRRGCNTRTATYTEEFDWDGIFGGTEDDIYNLIDLVKSQTKATRKRRNESSSIRGEAYDVRCPTPPVVLLLTIWSKQPDEEEDQDIPRTPRKKRKITSASTPQAHRVSQTPKTPTPKRYAPKTLGIMMFANHLAY
jgi:origin recognition complex subunit 1